MSTHIGTNFNYRGKRFLDSRQGGTLSKSDLKNWDFEEVPVPSGFELCLNGHSWYYYNPNVTIEETGHWIPRLVDITGIDLEDEDKIDFSNRSFDANALSNIIVNIENKIGDIHNEEVDPGQGNILSDVEARLEILEGIHFPICIDRNSVKINGVSGTTKTLEVGDDTTINPITFNLIKVGSGENTILVEGYKNYFTLPQSINSYVSTSKNLSITWGPEGGVERSYEKDKDGNPITATVYWRYKMYYGVVKNIPTANTEYTFPSGNNPYYHFQDGGFTTNGKLGKKTYNCSGGLHPCILVPDYYAQLSSYSPTVIVGGFKNTNISVIRNIYLTIPTGIKVKYVAVCLNQEQTGDGIEIELQ